MGHILTVKDKNGNTSSVEISNDLGVSKAVKTLQEKVEALQHRSLKSTINAKLPHNIGEKVYSSVPLNVYGYINFDGRKIYAYDEFGEFYEHIKDVYKLLNSEQYTYQLEKNYDVIGEPTDVYGTVSNFGHNSRYVRTKKVINFSDHDSWRIEFYIKMGQEVLSNKIYHIIGRENATYANGALLRVENSKFTIYRPNLSGTYEIAQGKTVLAPNTEYLVRLTYINNKYILSTKVINVEGAIYQYFKEFEVDGNSYGNSYIRFGDDYESDNIMNGEVDLNRIRFYDLSSEDLSDLDIFFDSAPIFYKPSDVIKTYTKQGFVPESVYDKELEKFGCSGKYVLNEEEQYVRIPLHKDRRLIVNQTYSDGSWLRVYDDGYCEQSGFTHPNGIANIANVETCKLHQPMKDVNYQIFTNMQYPFNEAAVWGYLCAKNLTTKTFQIVRQATYATNYEVKGYVNLDEVPEDIKNVPQDNFEYLVVSNGVQNIILDRNDELKVNNPFTLLESKYSRTKLNNISWLRYEGETLSEEKYPSAYSYLVQQRTILDTYNNWVNREDLTDFDNVPAQPDVIVKLSNEEHTENDYVINQENRTFILPVKSEANYNSELDKVDVIIHQSTTNGVNLKIYMSGYVEQEGTLNLSDEESEENTVVNYIVPINDSVIFIPNGLITERSNTSFTLTNVQGGISYRVSGFTTQAIIDEYKPEYRTSDLYLYYFMGDTVQNLSLINAGKLQEELLENKKTFKEYGNILKEVQGHTTKFSKTIAKTQVSKAVDDLVKQIKLRDVYTENMNENFLLPDPYFEGSKISFKGYNFYIFADSFKMFDEYSKRLYLLDIRYSENYSEVVDENKDYNLSYDVYFTYDKRKEKKTNVINQYSGDVSNLPDYDSKARLRIKVYSENTINHLNTPDGGENELNLIPLNEENSLTNIRNRHVSELPKLLRGESAESVDSLPLGEMEITFSGLRVSKVSGNFRTAGVNVVNVVNGVNVVNEKVFVERLSEFSMTVMNRYGSKTIIYDKTNVNQSNNNPCVFDFRQEMKIDDTRELVYRSDLDDYTTKQTENFNTKKTELTTAVDNKISEMDGKYSTFTSDVNTTVVQYENELDKRYKESIFAVDAREAQHNTTLTDNLNAEISRAESAESTLQSNIDTLTTNTTNNLNNYKTQMNETYSKVVVVDNIDKCTEDNIIYLVDLTWNNDYIVQTYEDREIKNLTHD